MWDVQRGIADGLNEFDYMASCGDVSDGPSPWIVSEWGRLDRKCVLMNGFGEGVSGLPAMLRVT